MTILYRAGTIHTMNPAQPTAGAVLVADGRIVAVGEEDELMGVAERDGLGPVTVDDTLAGSVVLPGLIDQHLHPLLAATTLATAVVSTEDWVLPDHYYPAANSAEEYRARLSRAEAELENPNEWLFSWGYHQLWHGELSRHILDQVSSTRPIGVWQRSCHEWYMNTAAMERLGVDSAWLAGKTGPAATMVDLERGHFWEGGFFQLILPKVAPELVSRERMRRGLHQMVEYLHLSGVTAYNEPGISWTIEPFDLYQEILGDPDTPLWSTFLVDGRTQAVKGIPTSEVVADAESQIARAPDRTGEEGQEAGLVTSPCLFDRQVKLFADGAIISQLMQMRDPYLDADGNPDPDHHGEWLMEPDVYRRYFDAYWDAGWQIHTHVNGDAGLDLVLDTMAAAQARHPRQDHRCVIVHFANSTEEQVDRIAELGAIVSANPYYPCGFADKYSAHGLGPERADSMVRSRSVLDRRIPLSFHSDLPMGPADPLKMAHFATERLTQSGRVADPNQRIGVHEALQAVTIGAAYSWRQESEIGSIEAGKRANFTVIDRDPYDAGGLDEIEVLGTVYGGRWFPVSAQRRAKGRWAQTPGQGDAASPGGRCSALSCSCVAVGYLADHWRRVA